MATGRTVRQGGSDIDALGDTQRIFEFNAKVTDSAVDLGMTQQQLNCSEIASLAIDFRCLCSAQRVRAVTARLW